VLRAGPATPRIKLIYNLTVGRIVNSSTILPSAVIHFMTPEAPVTPTSRREYAHAVRQRYAKVARAFYGKILK
jgi:hypothetical protein